MTILNTAKFQERIITELKSVSALTALVGTQEVREEFWQERDFTFPAVRVAIDELEPAGENPGCGHWIVPFRVQVWSDKASSKQAQEILTVAAQALVYKTLEYSGYYKGLKIYPAQIAPHRMIATSQTSNVWTAQVGFEQYVWVTT